LYHHDPMFQQTTNGTRFATFLEYYDPYDPTRGYIITSYILLYKMCKINLHFITMLLEISIRKYDVQFYVQ